MRPLEDRAGNELPALLPIWAVLPDVSTGKSPGILQVYLFIPSLDVHFNPIYMDLARISKRFDSLNRESQVFRET